VAEAGINHNGSLETALRLVDAAADAGADAVKFQMFQAANLVTASAPTAQYQKIGCGEVSQSAMLRRLELTRHQFESVQKRCDQRSILFMASPFGEADVGRLSAMGVPVIKIASTELTNEPLLAAVAATGLPIILSTGASTEEEIRAGVRYLADRGAGGHLILLHCISCYPTPVDALNLRAVAELRRAFGRPCGLSDHSTSTQTGAWAVAAGACVLEKHFTLDSTAPGPDHAVSLDPHQLTEYVTAAREAHRALGMAGFGMNDLEKEVRDLARKSIVAARAVHRGALLTADQLILKRPGTGIAPNDWNQVIGRRAVVDIPGDTTLSWDMLA
jgi:sialic acid synthase SpsE